MLIGETSMYGDIGMLKEEIKYLPKDIIYKRNKAGKTPFDLFLEP